jgi:hypothetical protein
MSMRQDLSKRARSRIPGWGLGMAALGVLLMLIGSGLDDGDSTGRELLTGGLMTGIGGILLVVGIITLIVGIVRRQR